MLENSVRVSPRARRRLTTRRTIAATLAICVATSVALLTGAPPASAAAFSGGFSPTVFDNKMDLNGDNEVTSADDSTDFFGGADIIDGQLDCNAWGPGTSNPGGVAAENNDGNDHGGGSGTIDGGDDCTLIAFDGTNTGKHIQVADGLVQLPDGPMPTVYPDCDGSGGCNDSSVVNARFAWQTIAGKVDANGNGSTDNDDCTVNIIAGVDVLSNSAADNNICGFSPHPADSSDGLVDLNGDSVANSADSCTNGCFFRHNLTSGVVQGIPSPAAVSAFTGTFGPTILNKLADVNGDGVVDSNDDSNAFFGDTSIIDGAIDCNAWGPGTSNTGGVAAENNDGNDNGAGSGTIDASDKCTLIAYNGTATGQHIQVTSGQFNVSDGRLPTIFPACDGTGTPTCNDSSVLHARFAWEALGGKVDANGNQFIDPDDCAVNLAGSIDVLANSSDNSNICTYGTPPANSSDGMVDLNGDVAITSADTCFDGCFFGHDIKSGLVRGHGIDFNFDASTDVLWHNNSTGRNSVWFLNVEKYIGAAAINKVAALSWKPFGLADFNGDGDTDILWHNTRSGASSVWFIRGTTYIGNTAIGLTPPLAWVPFATVDFDGDGSPDILWHNTRTGANSVWYMDGTDVLDFDAVGPNPALSWQPIDAADFDADNQADIFWHNNRTGENSVWIMDPATSVDVDSFEVINKTAALSWHPYAARDFNGDGAPDILWHNTSSSNNSIWLLDGTDFVSALAVTKKAALAWVPL